MSIPNSPFSTRIAAMPNDALATIYEFLKTDNIGDNAGTKYDEAILATALVCRSWRNDPGLQRERNEATPRVQLRFSLQDTHTEMDALMEVLRTFPRELVNIFQRAHRPIHLLPMIHLPNPVTDYTQLNPGNMGAHPVVRFMDNAGRPGVAVLAQGNTDEIVEPRLGNRIQVQGCDAVLSIFKRYPDLDSIYWVWSTENAAFVEILKHKHTINGHVGHLMQTCPTCPLYESNEMNAYPVVTDLLNRRSPTFIIPDPVNNDAAQPAAPRNRPSAAEEKKEN